MQTVGLSLSEPLYSRLMDHLSPLPGRAEELAFVFADHGVSDGKMNLRGVDWFPVPPMGFAGHSEAYLELADELRGLVIKKAHDLGACLVEFHTHPFPASAEFSGSDLEGLAEFVPHARWRLKARPYVAVVVGPSTFDALVWIDDTGRPGALGYLRVGERVLRPTGFTLSRLDTRLESNDA